MQNINLIETPRFETFNMTHVTPPASLPIE